jgi:hypothetical protein
MTPLVTFIPPLEKIKKPHCHVSIFGEKYKGVLTRIITIFAHYFITRFRYNLNPIRKKDRGLSIGSKKGKKVQVENPKGVCIASKMKRRG